MSFCDDTYEELYRQYGKNEEIQRESNENYAKWYRLDLAIRQYLDADGYYVGDWFEKLSSADARKQLWTLLEIESEATS